MALESFKQQVNKDNLDNQLKDKWVKDLQRIRLEIIDDFCSFLSSEGFSIKKSEGAAVATYQTAEISIEIEKVHHNAYRPSTTYYYPIIIKFNKWGPTVQVCASLVILNQPIAESTEDDCFYGYHKYSKDPAAFKKYIDNYQPSKYEFSAVKENDRSQIGFFGKVFSTATSNNRKDKRFKNMKNLVEAVLNNEFENNGIW